MVLTGKFDAILFVSIMMLYTPLQHHCTEENIFSAKS
jgi:hypothetical protein